MGDLVYAALVISIIWAGIFFYLVGQSRRMKQLEERVAGMVDRNPVVTDRAEEPIDTEESTEA
ncbi:CcmD family protein [Gemmatimonadota bacterium]